MNMLNYKHIAPRVLIQDKRRRIESEPFNRDEFLTVQKVLAECGVANALARFSDDSQRLVLDELLEVI